MNKTDAVAVVALVVLVVLLPVAYDEDALLTVKRVEHKRRCIC